MSYLSATLRLQVTERAHGRCEYCLISEMHTFVKHEVDHVIAEKHGGETQLDNLALSCTLCNRHKGSDLASLDPQTDKLTPLFNPRIQSWADHFVIQDGYLVALTDVGRVTLRLLHLNDPLRVMERVILMRAGLFP